MRDAWKILFLFIVLQLWFGNWLIPAIVALGYGILRA